MAGSRELDFELRRLYLRCMVLHTNAEAIIPEAASARNNEWVFVYPKKRALLRSQKNPSLIARSGYGVTFELPFAPNLPESLVLLGWRRQGIPNLVLSSPAPEKYEGKIVKEQKDKNPVTTDILMYPESLTRGLVQRLYRGLERNPIGLKVAAINSIILPDSITIHDFFSLPYTVHSRKFD